MYVICCWKRRNFIQHVFTRWFFLVLRKSGRRILNSSQSNHTKILYIHMLPMLYGFGNFEVMEKDLKARTDENVVKDYGINRYPSPPAKNRRKEMKQIRA